MKERKPNHKNIKTFLYFVETDLSGKKNQAPPFALRGREEQSQDSDLTFCDSSPPGRREMSRR